MRVLQVRRGLDFREETFRSYNCGQLRLEDLERNVPVVLYVLGEVDGGHPTFAQLSLDLIAPF